MSDRSALRAPGIYQSPKVPLRSLTGVRMDVCAFVGVAPRGPAREIVVGDEPPDDPARAGLAPPRRRSVAVPVESWTEYQNLYGGFEGPGLLPYAVATFFEQGGARAYIVRIVHDYSRSLDDDPKDNALGVATGPLLGVRTRAGNNEIRVAARNEGVWGNRLKVTLSFRVRPLVVDHPSQTRLILRRGTPLSRGALLRITLPTGTIVFRSAADVVNDWQPEKDHRTIHVTLDLPLPVPPDRVKTKFEVVEAIVDVDDRAGNVERHQDLGFSPAHPRWMGTVLRQQSRLIDAADDWMREELEPSSTLLREVEASEEQFDNGVDRSADIVPEDFFDADWTLGDDTSGNGVHALVNVPDVSLLVVPDLYSPRPFAPDEPLIDEPVGPATFAPCDPLPEARRPLKPRPDLLGLRLDPRHPGDRPKIVALQRKLVDLAEALASFVVLLDVPPGLHHRQILAWRAELSSGFAAAYHPWLQVSRLDDQRDSLIRINPSAVAAGIIAKREHLFGVPFGPANELAVGVVGVEDAVSPARHDELHPSGINVFLRERDGIRLTAARTLSPDRAYQQLSVRRLMTMLRRVLERQTLWMVFEPYDGALQGDIRHFLLGYLRQLYLANAFQGATEDEAFFVRCDDSLNTRDAVDAGRLYCEVGVAPAEPLEFLVLRIASDRDGTLTVKG